MLDAVTNGNLTETRRLLSIYVESVNARYDNFSSTLLIKAAGEGNRMIVKELLKYNVDVNAQNEIGWAALHYFSLHDYNVPVVKELLNHHADINLKDSFGNTALMKASYIGAHKIIKELLNYHASINVQNSFGETALILASTEKHTQIVMELINHNADVNFQDRFGNTALHLVLLEEFTGTTINIVKLLLSHFTNLETVNKDNKSVIHLAKESQNQEIIDLIEDYLDQKKIEAAKREFKKLQVHRIIKKRKRKILRLNAVNDEVLDLQQKINQKETRNMALEEELKKNHEEVKTWQCLLKRKIESEDFKTYKKLKEENKYFERCYETEEFDNVLQPIKRECPICFNEIRTNEKIYQCQSGHILCEKCFSKIKEKSKICPSCKIDIVSSPIRCRALEKVIEEEANE